MALDNPILTPLNNGVTNIGTYHMANNYDVYEVARTNNFEFVIPDTRFLRAGAAPNSEAYISGAQEIIRMSVVSSSVPHFQIEPLTLRRGNSVMKYAGVPTFPEGTITLKDYIGADTKSVVMAWQAMAYNVMTEKVGSLDVTPYKQDCYLNEYTPDYRLIRSWKLRGCWVGTITENEFNNEQNEFKTITATLHYDSAIPDISEFF